MKNKFTILGCGSSLGAPWITNYWGNLKKKNKKNIRTRCCAHIQFKNMSRTRQDMSEKDSKTSLAHFTLIIPHISKKIFEYLDNKSVTLSIVL